MKIELRINNDALMAVNELLKKIYDLPISVDPIENVYRGIGFDLSDMFDKKARSKVKKANLFDQKKLIKFTLKFQEGWALHKLLINLKPYGENEFIRHQIQTVIDKLDPKVC